MQSKELPTCLSQRSSFEWLGGYRDADPSPQERVASTSTSRDGTYRRIGSHSSCFGTGTPMTGLRVSLPSSTSFGVKRRVALDSLFALPFGRSSPGSLPIRKRSPRSSESGGTSFQLNQTKLLIRRALCCSSVVGAPATFEGGCCQDQARADVSVPSTQPSSSSLGDNIGIRREPGGTRRVSTDRLRDLRRLSPTRCGEP